MADEQDSMISAAAQTGRFIHQKRWLNHQQSWFYHQKWWFHHHKWWFSHQK